MKVTLTREQIQRLTTYFALDESIESVTIEESYKSGIGANHWATFQTSKLERDFEADITDVGNW